MGTTFDIQRFGIEDDPGICTGVFFAARQPPEVYRDPIVRASSSCAYRAGLARLVQDEIVAWREHTL
jgi:hypothetical protein